MPHPDKAPGGKRPRIDAGPTVDEAASFLRNLTSLPDAEFASTYSPAIAAAFAAYDDLPNSSAAKRPLLYALKAALKRRRAFIVPRFTDAEDSWRIRECVSYALAVAVLVEHVAATMHGPNIGPEPSADLWTAMLTDPVAAPPATAVATRAALFRDLVPARGRRWIANEPLVSELLTSYFAGTAPNELREIAAPVLDDIPRSDVVPTDATQDEQETHAFVTPGSTVPRPARYSWAARLRELVKRERPGDADVRGAEPPSNHAPAVQRDALETAAAVAARLGLDTAARHDLANRLKPVAALLAQHDASLADLAPAAAASANPPSDRPNGESTPDHRAVVSPVYGGTEKMAPVHADDSPTAAPHVSTTASLTPTEATLPPREPPGPKRHRRNRSRIANVLDGLPAAVASVKAEVPSEATSRARRPAAIGDHGATTARIGHGADYARALMIANGSLAKPNREARPLPGPITTAAAAEPLNVDALFPAHFNAAHVSPDAIGPWTAFRTYLAEALRTGALTANDDHSLVHLLETDVFLVWPGIAWAYAHEHRVSPMAIKAAMRAARVLAVNRADRQDDKHAFPALTGDPRVVCHGLVTLPEYLWRDAAHRPREASRFVRPPALYGQRYRRKH